jgi:hypothetical protein
MAAGQTITRHVEEDNGPQAAPQRQRNSVARCNKQRHNSATRWHKVPRSATAPPPRYHRVQFQRPHEVSTRCNSPTTVPRDPEQTSSATTIPPRTAQPYHKKQRHNSASFIASRTAAVPQAAPMYLQGTTSSPSRAPIVSQERHKGATSFHEAPRYHQQQQNGPTRSHTQRSNVTAVPQGT